MSRSSLGTRVGLENLEPRQLMADSTATILGIKVAKRVDTDGTSLNSNRITVAFSKPITLLDASKLRSFGYANDLSDYEGQVKQTVNMTVTNTSDSNVGVLTIVTDRLIRKGSRLLIYLGAVQDNTGADVVYDASSSQKTITFAVGQNKPRYSIANRNWKPTDLTLFSNEVFTASPSPTTASTEPSEGTVRAALETFLNKKVAKGILTSGGVTSALGVFDSATTKGTIPSANLRAALLSLLGTAGEPAISCYLNGKNVTGKAVSIIAFSNSTSASAPVAETSLTSNGRLRVTLHDEFAGESFINLSAVLAHECMHQDVNDTIDEEYITNVVEATVRAQQLLIDSSAATTGTVLAARQNQRLLALLNSGDGLFPYGGTKEAPALSNQGNVFPGAKTLQDPSGNTATVKSFVDWVYWEYKTRGFNTGPTNTNTTAKTILATLFGANNNFTLFGSSVLTNTDKGNLILTDVTYVKLGIILKLGYNSIG